MNTNGENNNAVRAAVTETEADNHDALIITEDAIIEFQHALRENEHSEATIEKYSTAIRRLKEYLNGEPVSKERLLNFRKYLKEDRTAQTVNCTVSAINSFLELNEMAAMKIRHLKVQRSAFCPEEKELSMDEYERLVKTAKELGREQLSLIIETLGSAGIRASELAFITVEAVRKRKVEITLKGKIRTIMLTGKLCKKLKKFAEKRHMISGSAIRENEDLMFLTAKNMKKMMGIEESLLYEFLRNAPFRVEKIGGKLLLPAPSFRAWYFKDFDNAA